MYVKHVYVYKISSFLRYLEVETCYLPSRITIHQVKITFSALSGSFTRPSVRPSVRPSNPSIYPSISLTHSFARFSLLLLLFSDKVSFKSKSSQNFTVPAYQRRGQSMPDGRKLLFSTGKEYWTVGVEK